MRRHPSLALSPPGLGRDRQTAEGLFRGDGDGGRGQQRPRHGQHAAQVGQGDGLHEPHHRYTMLTIYM